MLMKLKIEKMQRSKQYYKAGPGTGCGFGSSSDTHERYLVEMHKKNCKIQGL
jgi:hypothetical protein